MNLFDSFFLASVECSPMKRRFLKKAISHFALQTLDHFTTYTAHQNKLRHPGSFWTSCKKKIIIFSMHLLHKTTENLPVI